jgi:hypothetical protein
VIPEAISGAPKDVKVLHFSQRNLSGIPLSVSMSAIQQAAVFAGYVEIGSEAASMIATAEPTRGKLRALGGLLLYAPMIMSAGSNLDIIKSPTLKDPRVQAGALVITGLVWLVKSRQDARARQSEKAISKVVTDSASRTLQPGESWSGYMGVSGAANVAVLVDHYADGGLATYANWR